MRATGDMPDGSGARANILLVDDRAPNLLALAAVLETLGHELVSVRSGRDALAAVAAQDFAVVLLDVQMPEMDGFETALRMKSIERARHTPIIFMTAIVPDEANVRRAYAGGAVDFISKPFEPDVLRSKVRVFVDLFLAKEALRRHQILLGERERSDLLARERAARSEAETLARELQEAHRVKDEFLATLSHELRTPLNAILGWTRMLRAGTIREERRAQALDTVERNAAVQLQLVEDMLDISRITSGKLSLRLGAVDLVKVIAMAMDTVRPAAQTKGVRLVTHLQRDVAPIRGDADRLQQVVWNLLNNAMKFTPAGGEISVSLAATGRGFEIAVTDNGEGIAPAFLPHVFERFRQADGGTTRLHGGLGLGLAIVKHLVEQHGATIEASSDGRGMGATFVVVLPIGASARASTPPPPEPAGPQFAPDLSGLRVLVVDDEEDGRELLSSLLEACKASVACASSAQEAMEKLIEWEPHVLVSDIGMPGEDGYALLERVRGVRHVRAEAGRGLRAARDRREHGAAHLAVTRRRARARRDEAAQDTSRRLVAQRRAFGSA